MSSSDDIAELRRAAHRDGDYSALIASVPYAKFLGIDISMVAGQPRFRLPFRPQLVGSPELKALHGGVTAGFMENAGLLHLLLMLDEPRIPRSIDFSIDYLRSAQGGRDCHADCEVSRAGSRVAQVLISCWQGEPAYKIALARAHFLTAAT